LIGDDLCFPRRSRRAAGGASGNGGLGHEHGHRYPVDWNQRKASGGVLDDGEQRGNKIGQRGSL
jgi:hypothetical protein